MKCEKELNLLIQIANDFIVTLPLSTRAAMVEQVKIAVGNLEHALSPQLETVAVEVVDKAE